MPNALTITVENEESRLELVLAPAKDRILDAAVLIQQGALALTFSSYCFGYDLAEFANELEVFHRRYEGVARFVNQAGDMELEFSVVHPGRGIIGVIAKLEHMATWPRDSAPTQEKFEQRKLEFQGFTIEQSFLPSLVTRIREFIDETGVSTIHPMIDGTRPRNP
jgi:hypothetical protein